MFFLTPEKRSVKRVNNRAHSAALARARSACACSAFASAQP
jgi:hypothetical protein